MIAKSLFRAYDIRGIVDETLTLPAVREIGLAFGSEAKSAGCSTVVIGRDGRLSSAGIAETLALALRATGCDVIDVGQVPTPVLYFATHYFQTGTGIMVTGSHNPPKYNGLKLMLASKTLYGDDIQALRQRIIEQQYVSGEGQYQLENILQAYLQTVTTDIKLHKKLKVVIDCGNGVTGQLAPELFRRLGCEVIELFTEIDGSFPNHHPDPSRPENLIDLQQAVNNYQADLGLAFDGDGDRLGVIDNRQNIIWPDRQMMLYAGDVLSRNPDALIIFDVKSSEHLLKVIEAAGGKALMWKAGHSVLKAKMQETGALLAGEMSGHIFFKERWYGFDDGLYTAARLLEIISQKKQSVADIFAALPNSCNTPEIHLQFEEGGQFEFMHKLSAATDFPGGRVTAVDGLRVSYPEGWGLIRASNTQPVVVFRFESDTPEGLKKIQTRIRQQVLKVDVTLEPGF